MKLRFVRRKYTYEIPGPNGKPWVKEGEHLILQYRLSPRGGPMSETWTDVPTEDEQPLS